MLIARFCPDEPSNDWTLEQLETYITTALKRTAIDAWLLGKALKCARRKVNQAKKQTWTDWKRCHNFSDTMVSRYIRLFEFYESADALGDMGVIEACEQAGILAPRGKSSRESKDQPEQNGPYAWAVKEKYDEQFQIVFEVIRRLTELPKEEEKPIIGFNRR